MYIQKMYSIVLMHLNGRQQGIQHSHSKDVFELKFSHLEKYQQWLRTDKTVIVLETYSTKLLNSAADELIANNVEVGVFKEEDLDDITTSISFLVDERVWDFETYPNVHVTFPYLEGTPKQIREEKTKLQIEANIQKYGPKIAFLKEFTRRFNLASS
ncbi:MAG: hypothetical protein ABIP51_16715 [Bacteroidia bacterium]